MKKVMAVILILVILAGTYYYSSKEKELNSNIVLEKKVIKENTIKIDVMKESLMDLKEKIIKSHDKVRENEEYQQIYEKDFEEMLKKADKEMTISEFYFMVARSLVKLKDGHTTLNYDGIYEKDILPINFKWLEEGMVVYRTSPGFKKGDVIIKMGDKTEEEILSQLRKIVPSENDYWIKHNAEMLLKSGFYLRELGLVDDDKVKILAKREEKEFIKEVDMGKYTMTWDFSRYKRPHHRYEISGDGEYGVFELNKCTMTKEYKEDLAKFFKEVEKKQIKKIALDLRGNYGGYQTVTDEFLSYLEIEEYLLPMHRLEVGILNHKKHVISKLENTYDGEVYLFIGNGSFSGASIIAHAFKENNIATLIGEPTGNASEFFGAGLPTKVGDTGIIIYIGSQKVISPFENKEEAIMPDVKIPLTSKDIKEGRDPVMEWFKKQ